MLSFRGLARIVAAIAVVAGSVLVVEPVAAAPARLVFYPSWEASSGCAHVAPSQTEFICNGGGIITTVIYAQYSSEGFRVSLSPIGTHDVPLLNLAIWDVNNSANVQTSSYQSGVGGSLLFSFDGLSVGSSPSEMEIELQSESAGPYAVTVGVSPLAVPTATNTPNPSFTATNTPVPGTPPPSYTPRPGPVQVTDTPVPSASATATVAPYSLRDCGVGIVFRNCDLVGPAGAATYWNAQGAPSVNYCESYPSFGADAVDCNGVAGLMYQQFTATETGYVCWNVHFLTGGAYTFYVSYTGASGTWVQVDHGSTDDVQCSSDVGWSVVNGGSVYFAMTGDGVAFVLTSVSMVATGATSTVTPTPSATSPVASSTPTATTTPIGAPCDPAIFGTVECGGAQSSGGCDLFDLLCWITPRCLSCDISPLAAAVETEVPVSAGAVDGLGSMVNSSQVCSDIGGSGPIFVNPRTGSTVAQLHFKPCGMSGFSSFWPGVRVLALVISYVLFIFWILRFVQRVFGRRNLTP